jgi:hypothetical protein
VPIHVDHARHAHARRLDDINDADANGRTVAARRRGFIHRHVGRDDGSDDVAVLDANVMALSDAQNNPRKSSPRESHAFIAIDLRRAGTIRGWLVRESDNTCANCRYGVLDAAITYVLDGTARAAQPEEFDGPPEYRSTASGNSFSIRALMSVPRLSENIVRKGGVRSQIGIGT